MNTKRVLSIDPGFGRCGWAVLEKGPSIAGKSGIVLISCDCIETSAKHKLHDRLCEIYQAVDYLIKKFKPQEFAIESLFWFKNQKTIMGVSEARGAIIVAAKNNSLPVFEYTPLQVKQAVVGYGKATKDQINKMIKLHLKQQVIPKQDDTADAVAVGLTHLQTLHL